MPKNQEQHQKSFIVCCLNEFHPECGKEAEKMAISKKSELVNNQSYGRKKNNGRLTYDMMLYRCN